MLARLKKFWDDYGLEFLAAVSIIVLIILYIFNLFFKDKGTYNLVKNYNNYNNNNTTNKNNLEYMQHTANDSKLELQAKFILEDIFKRPFYKIRPDFLKNDVTGYNLEIDLYNDELKLAVEVQGDQHYKFIPFFHKTKADFMNQRYRDEMKKDKCRKEGLTLIEIPYKVGKNLKSYLVEQLRLERFLV